MKVLVVSHEQARVLNRVDRLVQIANLGDSGFRVFRDDKCLFASHVSNPLDLVNMCHSSLTTPTLSCSQSHWWQRPWVQANQRGHCAM